MGGGLRGGVAWSGAHPDLCFSLLQLAAAACFPPALHRLQLPRAHRPFPHSPAPGAGKGQTLRTVGTADVTAKIARLAGHAAGAGAGAAQQSSREVLAWAMVNTVAATQRGVLEWAHQGLL